MMHFLEWKRKGKKGRITQNLPSPSIAWSEWFLNLSKFAAVFYFSANSRRGFPPQNLAMLMRLIILCRDNAITLTKLFHFPPEHTGRPCFSALLDLGRIMGLIQANEIWAGVMVVASGRRRSMKCSFLTLSSLFYLLGTRIERFQDGGAVRWKELESRKYQLGQSWELKADCDWERTVIFVNHWDFSVACY